MLNTAIVMGRLTADPELRYTPNNTAVTSFCLAVDRDYKTRNGEKQTDFLNFVAWRNTAEFIAKYFRKGQILAVTGSINNRVHTDKEGNKRTQTEIVVDHAYFGGEREKGENPKPDIHAQNDTEFITNDAEQFMPIEDEDLPF